jgi:demethoxyubiquinone hydroxylase (CLK1/Coq7/Cat5 family)
VDNDVLTHGARGAGPAFFRTGDVSGILSPAHVNQRGNALMAQMTSFALSGELTEQDKKAYNDQLDKLVENQVKANPFGGLAVARIAVKATAQQMEAKAGEVFDSRIAVFKQEAKQEAELERSSFMKNFFESNDFQDAVVDTFDKKICASIGKASRMVTEEQVDKYHKKHMVPFMNEFAGVTAQIQQRQDNEAQKQASIEQRLNRMEAFMAAGGAGPAPAPQAPAPQAILPTPGALNAARANGIADDQAWLLMDATGAKVLTGKALQKRVTEIRNGTYP